ncbi:MAG TPA: TPM domain-containing protein [Caulobacterales bacterium]|nr:TPM domain-containing protein [Caulobacterales bacterium]
MVDAANVLSPRVEAELTDKLARLETQTSRQLVIVTVPSLQGYEIEDYGYQLGRAWGIGQNRENNGVLLIVAPNERRVRIEVGYGLEGVLTDALSDVILQAQVLPKFRTGDFEGGIVAGVDALIEQLSLPDDQARARVAASTQAAAAPNDSAPIVVLGLLGLWAVFGIFGMITGRPGHRMDLWVLPLLLLMSGSRRGRGGRGGGFRGGGGSFGGGGASGGW